MSKIKQFGYKIGIQFNNTILVIDKTAKIVNAYIVYDLDYWLRNLLYIFVLKNCLFGNTNIVKYRVL